MEFGDIERASKDHSPPPHSAPGYSTQPTSYQRPTAAPVRPSAGGFSSPRAAEEASHILWVLQRVPPQALSTHCTAEHSTHPTMCQVFCVGPPPDSVDRNPSFLIKEGRRRLKTSFLTSPLNLPLPISLILKCPCQEHKLSIFYPLSGGKHTVSILQWRKLVSSKGTCPRQHHSH